MERDTDTETREEDAAAEEAAAIGGTVPGQTGDEALRPVEEAGGGEAEGFEQAERDLIRNASHDDGRGLPEVDGFTPENEQSDADFGEADGETGPEAA